MSTLKVDDIQSRQSTDDAISLASDSSVSLKHSASAKLTTTSTGVSVTGTCAATTVTATSVTGTSVEDSKGDLRKIVQNAQTSAYSLVAADAGKHISITTGGVTIPASVFAAGDAITIVNDSASDQTITCSAVTTYLANDTSTKTSLTLKARGIATFLFVSATVVYGAGAGLE
jgi:hypothetical protein|tara:strand:+ start:581 stop:1099 length:519 start_codon:yes stop_codon:yes gene_type:complete